MPRRRRFTDADVGTLPVPNRGRDEHPDPEQLGLVIRVSHTGVRSFCVLFRVHGERRARADGTESSGAQHRLTLEGRWPKLDLESARAEARRILAQASSGIDPRAERAGAVERAARSTVSALVPQFLEDHRRSVASWRNGDYALRRIPSSWANRPLSSITRADVHAALDAVVEDGKVGAARALREALRKLFRWAEDRDFVVRNPAAGLQRRDLRPNPSAGRALDDEELRAVWLAARAMPEPFGPLFSVLLLCGARLTEVAHAQWGDLDASARAIFVSAERFKSRRDHLIVLGTRAWDILCKVRRRARGDFVFTSTEGESPVSGFTRASNTLRKLAGAIYRKEVGDELAHFRAAHDLRVTCRTRLAELRIPPHVAEAVLGHAQPTLHALYNKADLVAERRAALELYERHVLEVAGG